MTREEKEYYCETHKKPNAEETDDYEARCEVCFENAEYEVKHKPKPDKPYTQ